jgi:predicted Zn-dependent peptidase
MKKIFVSILLLQSLNIFAQELDRSRPPKPGPAPEINIPDPASFTLPNGLKVFVVRNTKLPQVSATLTINREAIREGKKAGMANMAGELLRYGTTKMKKDQLDEAIDFLGASVSTSALSASASSLTGNFPKAFALMADVVLRPSMPPYELEKIRRQTLSGIESQKDDPEGISQNVSNALLFGKSHPFGEIMTAASVKSVTMADIKKFYSTTWKPNNAYLVFVGDISAEQAKKLAVQYFGSWKKGVVVKESYVAVKAPAKTYVAIVDRPASVQSVIKIATPVSLKPGAPDAIAASLMNNIIGGGFSSRLMQNLREKYGFTYGSRSSLTPNPIAGSFSAGASVRNEKTDSAIGQMLFELNRINTTIAADTEVTSLKNYMSGGFARSLESPATIAEFALNIARYGLPRDYYRNYLTRLAAVTPAQVQEVAKKYITPNNMVIVVVGNAKEISKGLDKYGELHYFDIYGNEVAAPVVKNVAPDIKGEDVLKKAIAAYGGETTISSLKDLELNGSVNIMGQEFSYIEKHVFPNDFAVSVTMSGMTIMKQTRKDTVYTSQMQGNDVPVDEDSKEEMNSKAKLFAERYLLSNPGNNYVVKAIEQVEGKDAYVVQINSANGDTSTAYYDVASGLKVQELRHKETPMGNMSITTSFKDYKTYEGVKIPTKLVVDLGQFKQDITIESVKVNQGLKVSDL